MKETNYSQLLALILLLSGDLQQLHAQQFSVNYDAEIQTDFRGHANQLNRLYLGADLPLSDALSFKISTLSIARVRNENLLDDLQAFSNIEADNAVMILGLAELEWNLDNHHRLCAGIRNMNEDYFISPVTSLFTNSSCGIFPTVAMIEDIGNYPLSTVGLHYAYTADSWGLQASVYNGLGHSSFTGADCVGRFTPHSEGLFFLAQGNYSHRGGDYYLGACLHTGTQADDACRTALWAYTEQQVTPRLALIADASHTFGPRCLCTDFYGLGAQYSLDRCTLGLFTDYARFAEGEEQATELTCQYQFTPLLSLQASYHLIHNDDWQSAGLIRLSFTIE